MKAEDIWKIWDEVIGVDVGIDPVSFAEAVLNAAPTGDIEHVAQVLACEIECSIFEQHVAPALEVALKALSPTQGADAQPVASGERERFEAHWCRDVPAMYRVAALAEIRAIRDKERYKRDDIQWSWESWQAALATRDAAPSDAISDVLAERERQDAQWGGQDHDDQHTKADWQNYIYRQHYAASSFCGTPEQYRMRLVKIAALAVAAIESIDRIAAGAPMEKT